MLLPLVVVVCLINFGLFSFVSDQLAEFATSNKKEHVVDDK